jgi:mRNA interferase MazF
MVAVARGEIWWADLAEPAGSEPGFLRPVIVVQGDPLNRSRIGTVVVVPLTGNLQWADAPGNVTLAAGLTGLAKDSVANVSQVATVDKRTLTERISKLPRNKLDLVYAGIDIVFDR